MLSGDGPQAVRHAPAAATLRNTRRDPTPPAPPPASGSMTGSAAPRPVPDPETPFALTVLGTLRLLHRPGGQGRHEPVDGVTPKAREVLAFLALHPDGARRDAITAAVWPAAEDDRRLANRFYAALSQLRAAVRTTTGGAFADVTTSRAGRYALRRDLVTADVWQLRDALGSHRRAAAGSDERLAALSRAAELYTGDLADEVSGDWAAAPRESLRRDVLDALGGHAHSLGDDAMEHKLDLFERLRNLDPYNEAVYRDIAAAQARLGRHDAIPRTLSLLTAALADIDEHPAPDTAAFFATLRHPRPTCPA